MSAESIIFERTVEEALRRFRIEALNNPNIIGSAPFLQVGVGAIPRTVLSKLQETIDAADFGVIGDGVTDDTAAVQLALDAGATQGKVVNFRALTCMISGALTSAGPGFLFDTVSHGDMGGPGFLMTGTATGVGSIIAGKVYSIVSVGTTNFVAIGAASNTAGLSFTATAAGSGTGTVTYTAMTVTGLPQVFAACFYGTGNTVNGVQFQNPILSRIQHCRVFDLDGFGVKVNRCFDCVFETISVEQCGNATDYAFSVNDDTETANESRFMRIQVEKANTKAIFVSANTLSCVFDVIHSEQATGDAITDTWYLGGSRCVYNAVRLAALVPADGICHLVGGDTSYNALLTEGAIAVNVEGSNTLAINGCEINGTLTPIANQTALIVLTGGYVANIAGQAKAFRAFGVNIGTLTVDFTNNPVDVTLARYYNCDIATLASSSTLSAATFDGCVIAEGGNLLRGGTILNNCDVTCSGTVAHSSGMLVMSNTTLHAALTYTNHATIRLSDKSRITGTVSCGDAGNVDFLCDDSSTIGSGSSGVGIPTGGAHNVGDRHRNPLYTAGGTVAWVCTVAGTPGTFVVEGAGGASGHTLTFGTNLTGSGASYDGSANVTIATNNPIVANLTGNASGSSGSCTGNAATATQATNATSVNGGVGGTVDTNTIHAHSTAQIDGTLTMGADILLANTFVATPIVGTGYLIIKDGGGTPYKISVAP